MLEKRLEAKIVKKAKELGYLTYKFTSPSNRGVPDRMFINPYGYVFFMEFKSEKGILSSLQKKIKKDIESCGIDVFIVSDIEWGIEILKVKNCA